MPKKSESRSRRAIRETAEDLYAVGAMDYRTMKSFDRSSLPVVESLAPEEIRTMRAREAASQAVLAAHLGVTPGLVSQWERGTRKPQGSSLKLLNLVKRKGLAWIAV